MPVTTRFTITFDDQTTAAAVRATPETPPADAITALNMPPFGGTVIMHGGAGGMAPELVDAVRDFFRTGLAPVAEAHRLLVVDGGTRAGTVAAMGDARVQAKGTYPLVGIVPSETVAYPGGPAADDSHYPLDSGHSHFLLVEGDSFGIESELMTGIIRAVPAPGVALIVNGGQIVLAEAQRHAALGNTIIVVRGSGRMADELADPTSAAHATLDAAANLQIADLDQPGAFRALLARVLGLAS